MGSPVSRFFARYASTRALRINGYLIRRGLYKYQENEIPR
jgi:hypothetical protein